MRNNVLTVMKKECRRIFGDRRLFITAVLLPGFMMFVMYSFMGTFFEGLFSVEDEYRFEIHAVNMPNSVKEILPPEEFEILHVAESEIENIKQKITDRTTDLLLIFPPEFDTLVSDLLVPNIQIFSNNARSESQNASRIVTGLLNDYHYELTHRFSIEDFNLATEADMFGMLVGMIIPMLFVIFMFSGCQALAPESIAGEKERGTLGSILVTPANRAHIALGKILGIGIFALMSEVVSILGAVIVMPSLMVLWSSNVFDFYSATDFVLLILVAISTTLIFVSMLSVFSALAKSVKEATAYAMPIMIVVILAGLSGVIMGDIPEQFYFFLIPVVNSSLCISAIFSFNASVIQVFITVAVNLAVALVFTVVLAKIFSSERVC